MTPTRFEGIEANRDENGLECSEPIESGISAISDDDPTSVKTGLSGSDCTKCTKLDELIAKALSALASGDVDGARQLLLEMQAAGH